MFNVDLAYPFTLGLVAAFNPCGFAMLPVYVSFFLGKNTDHETSTARNLLRAIKVGGALTAGFVAVFGAFGFITSGAITWLPRRLGWVEETATGVSSGAILEYTPYVTFVMGILLVPLGIAMLFFGFELKISTPRLEAGGDSGEVLSMFIFGVSYAVVSLGCTIGLFILGVSTVFTSGGFVDGVSVFVAYGLGMGSVIMVLTLALAMARTSVANNMRKILPWVNRISGVLLVLSGAYLVVYGWWEIQVLRGNITSNSLVSFFERFQAEVNIWIDQTGATRLGIAFLLIVVAALLRGLWNELPQAARSLGVVALVVGWVLAEFAKVWNGERANLFILPIIRTVLSIPSRIGNWFTDPLRWGTLGELVVLGFIAFVVYFRAKKWMAARETPQVEAPAEREPVTTS